MTSKNGKLNKISKTSEIARLSIEDQEDTLEKIYNASLNFLEPTNLDQTCSIIIQEAINLVHAEFGSIFLYKNGELERIYASDPAFYKIRIRKNGYTYQVFKTGKPVILNSPEINKIHPYSSVGLHHRSDVMIPLSDNGRTIGVMTVMSMTDQKFSEREITILKMLGPLASLAINKSNFYEDLTKALETRDLFISMAAHELRTPLTAVSGYAQLLYSKLHNGTNSESRWVEQLYWETKRMANLVNELLEINRIKTGQLNYYFKECSIRDIIDRISESFNFSYPERHLVIKDQINGSSDMVIADYDKIMQIFSNLVENAVKFSPADTPIVIRLIPNGDDIVITIEDKGSGIAKEDMPKIFEDYFRGGAKEGMGIGLFIVKDIVQHHRGSVTVNSKLNKGTKVKIRLPRLEL